LFGTWQHLRNFSLVSTPTITGSQISFFDNIKTLGVTLDANLTLDQHVSSLCKLMHFHTRSLHHICPALSDCIAITVATLFVQSRLDYANCLCTIHRQPTYINYSVHKTPCLMSYSLAVIASTCQLACGFLISTGCQSVSVLISSWP